MSLLRPSSPPGPEKADGRRLSLTGALTVMGAAGMFLGQPNVLFHFPPLVLAFPFSLYLLSALAPSDKKAFFRCWLLGLAGHAAGLYWLVNPMHDVGGLPYELAWPGVLALCAYLACYSGLAGLGMRRLRRFFFLDGPGGERPEAGRAGGVFRAFSALAGLAPAALLAGCAYAGFEVLCGWLFTGFPWLSLSSAFALWPAWVQAASLVGSYGLSAGFAAAACLGASAFLAPSPAGRLAAGVLALGLAAAFPLYGGVRLAAPLPEPAGPPLSFVMVQGNIDQNQKWDPLFQEATITHYLNLSARALRDWRAAHPENGPALVLWPETAMPFYYQAHPEYAGRLRRFAAEHRVNLAFGTLGAAGQGRDGQTQDRLYNRLCLLSADGRGVAGFYDKQHLVPFGEYIPFASSLTFLRNIAQGMDFAPGATDEPLTLVLPPALSPVRPSVRPDPLPEASPPAGGGENRVSAPPWADQAETRVSLGVLICYEAIFPSLAQKRVASGATVLVNVSNDGWFGRSSAPLQHLGLAAMRAVEQARPIARATNTGYTVAIDSRGRVTQRGMRLFADDVLFATVRPSAEITVYHRIHPAPEAVLVASAFFSLFGSFLRRPKFSHP